MSEFFLSSDIEEIAAAVVDKAQAFSGKTVMLTGGRGFLGRYFTEVFIRLNASVLDQPCKVVVFDNLITAGAEGAKIAEADNITFREHDVIQPVDWDDDLDFIIHAAGIASPYYYRKYPLETLDVAITGTIKHSYLFTRNIEDDIVEVFVIIDITRIDISRLRNRVCVEEHEGRSTRQQGRCVLKNDGKKRIACNNDIIGVWRTFDIITNCYKLRSSTGSTG